MDGIPVSIFTLPQAMLKEGKGEKGKRMEEQELC